MRRIRDWVTGIGWIKLAVYGVLGLVTAVLLWTVVYRLFFQGDDLAREKGKNVVTTQVDRGIAHTTDTTINAVQARDTEQQEVRVTVTQGKDRINHAWHGETVGDDVDAAGRDALCRLHGTSNFCGSSTAPALQPVR